MDFGIHENGSVKFKPSELILVLAKLNEKFLSSRVGQRRRRTHRLQVPESQLELGQGHVGPGASVVALDVLRVEVYRLGRVAERRAEHLRPEVRETSVAPVDGLGRK